MIGLDWREKRLVNAFGLELVLALLEVLVEFTEAAGLEVYREPVWTSFIMSTSSRAEELWDELRRLAKEVGRLRVIWVTYRLDIGLRNRETCI